MLMANAAIPKSEATPPALRRDPAPVSLGLDPEPVAEGPSFAA